MKLNLLDMLKRAIKGKLEQKGASSEEADELAEETAEKIWSGVSNTKFDDVAASLREDYPEITDEELERAITIRDDGYIIHQHELPEKSCAKKLEEFKENGMWGV